MIKKLVTLLVLLICFFGYSQKKLLPNGDDYYHSYTKANDTVRIYNIADNLVREAYLKEGRAIDFNNEATKEQQEERGKIGGW
ncbi:hypothetical protein [Cellulophaga sp. L1A9]|uniref:hypothetical protein n=1 Tax=Cellulophaga sp. L1A9 TaxID=2686362 RepID=UPI00131B3442|nr:hypothetical protein [Cellulophaga sp. L1A9]